MLCTVGRICSLLGTTKTFKIQWIVQEHENSSPVSYTHLDVYKRQGLKELNFNHTLPNIFHIYLFYQNENYVYKNKTTTKHITHVYLNSRKVKHLKGDLYLTVCHFIFTFNGRLYFYFKVV